MIRPDDEIYNADWPKRSWDLPPYRSEEFMRVLRGMNMTLESFKTLPVYQWAVAKGVIVDDRWVGEAGSDEQD